MATIHIDSVPRQVKDGQNLLEACLSLGLDLPYFCWHPALGSVGACRQCAVKQFRDERDTRGRIVMACMTPAADGVRLSVEDPEAREFRAGVIEWMMLNHPHDCPVCDEGGECHLQDMTVMAGHTARRFRGRKRTFRNQDLGPFVHHEMNRCIQCYRCVRFYREYAGGRDLHAFVLRDHVYFGRHDDGVLESEFSGNLVEVCPTGVFTDKTLKPHYTRKWDLQTAPSVCVHCGLGCNTIPGERAGRLRRILTRYNGEVNGYFLCDRGRFGYEFVNSQRRIRRPLVRRTRGGEAAAKEEALAEAAALVAGGAGLIGIGSPRASLEANYALRALVGPERFFLGLSDAEGRLLSLIGEILRGGPARSASQREVGLADAVLVLGEDVTGTAPMLALALRQSVRRQPMEAAKRMRIPEWDAAAVREVVQDARGPLFLATPYATKIEEVATRAVHGAPDDLARLGFAVASAADGEASSVPDLPAGWGDLAADIARALRTAKRPLVVSGTGCGSRAVIEAAARVAWAICDGGHPAELCFAVPESNSLGLSLMGGRPLREAFQMVESGSAQTVVILENDLWRRADAAAVARFLEAAEHVILLDYLATPTAEAAHVLLPVATFAEGDGTLVNNEGRAQRYYQVFVPGGDVQESWRWLRDLLVAAGRPEARGWQGLDSILADLAGALPAFKPVTTVAPSAAFRMAGLRIPRQPHRSSGRTAMHANLSVHEPQPPEDLDAPLAFSMEGYAGPPPPSLIPRIWAPGWNSAQAVIAFQDKAGGPLRGGDPGRRLIEPSPDGRRPALGAPPGAHAPRTGQWLVVPMFHIFGSEELSILSPGIAERSPAPSLALHPADAETLGVEAGDPVDLALGTRRLRLPAAIREDLPRGLAGLPAGLPGLEGIEVPAWAAVSKASAP